MASCASTITTTDADHVTVVADGLEIDARYVVAADGMWSPVRKSIGANEGGYLGEWHGFRQYARNVTGPASQQLYVWFEPDLVPGLRLVVPVCRTAAPTSASGCSATAPAASDMKQLWADLLTRPAHPSTPSAAGFEVEDRHTAWPIPARVDEATLTAGRVLFTGDAAMATDVMTGEGIGQALLTGCSPPRQSSPPAPCSPTTPQPSTAPRCLITSSPTTACRRRWDRS
jgi:menaquinone-9 beta-reductase